MDRPPGLRRTRVYLVVDIGKVTHVSDVIFAVNEAQKPKQRVKNQSGSRVSDMRAVINRRSADIHTHVHVVDWLEPLLGSRPGIVEHDLGHDFLTRIAWLRVDAFG